MSLWQIRSVTAAVLLMLSACGGGGGDSGEDVSGTPWERRTAKSQPLANICAEPRSGLDPYNDNQPYPDTAGTLNDERRWLATYMDEVYLWYREIPNVDASRYTTDAYGSPAEAMAAYFYDLLTPDKASNGDDKDRFSFVYPTADYQALSQSGAALGYGMQIVVLAGRPPRDVVIAYTDAGAPAAAAGIVRGARILAIDGVDMIEGSDTDTLDAGLSPQQEGESHLFRIQNPGAAARDITLTAGAIVSDPVPLAKTLDTAAGRVGYLLFNEHVATAEGRLYDELSQLAAAGVGDLVLDLRYNGGGYLDIASELAYMIAGRAATANKTFERLQFNDKNPLAEDPSAVTPFHDTTLGFDRSVADGTPLPALNLDRVFVLAGSGTCSASEAVVNGLRGIGVEVVLIGATTCGKPYGFFAWDNCGTSYFPIEFQGVNERGEGGYIDGFAPDCAVADDFEHALGDPAEGRLAAALTYRDQGGCAQAKAATAAEPLRLLRPPVLENAWRRPRR